MRPTIIFSTIVLAALLGAWIIQPATAQTTTTPASLESMLSWTPSTTNMDGTPITDLKGYLITVSPDDVDMRVPGTPAIQTIKIEGTDLPPCIGEPCIVPAFRLFEGLAPGSYKVWGQAYDLAGNRSPYSEPSDAFALDTVTPSAPSGMSVTVKVIVEVRVQ